MVDNTNDSEWCLKHNQDQDQILDAWWGCWVDHCKCCSNRATPLHLQHLFTNTTKGKIKVFCHFWGESESMEEKSTIFSRKFITYIVQWLVAGHKKKGNHIVTIKGKKIQMSWVVESRHLHFQYNQNWLIYVRVYHFFHQLIILLLLYPSLQLLKCF